MHNPGLGTEMQWSRDDPRQIVNSTELRADPCDKTAFGGHQVVIDQRLWCKGGAFENSTQMHISYCYSYHYHHYCIHAILVPPPPLQYSCLPWPIRRVSITHHRKTVHHQNHGCKQYYYSDSGIWWGVPPWSFYSRVVVMWSSQPPLFSWELRN